MVTFAALAVRDHPQGSWDGPPWAAFAVVLLLAVLAIAAAALVLARRPWSRSALAVLDDRYARGEIDDEEFRRRRAELRTARTR